MKYLRHPIFKLIILIWIAFWIVQLLYARFWTHLNISPNFEAVSSLFNALAFAGIIITILLEQESLVVENFKTNFFNLLNMHNDLIKDLTVGSGVGLDIQAYYGRRIFAPYVIGLTEIHRPNEALVPKKHIKITLTSTIKSILTRLIGISFLLILY